MTEILNDPLINDFITSFASGQITWVNGFIWLLVTTAFSIAGGVIGGIILAGKDLGYELAAILGGFFGPAGAIPATIIWLLMMGILTS